MQLPIHRGGPGDNLGLVQDCQTLLSVKDAMGGFTRLGWDPERPLEEWKGIEVGGSPPRIHGLKLWRGPLGELPAGIGGLSELKVPEIAKSQLNSFIPPELGELENLERLNLAWNELSGEIPVELANLTNLRHLNLEGNELSGCIHEGLPEIWVEATGLSRCQN